MISSRTMARTFSTSGLTFAVMPRSMDFSPERVMRRLGPRPDCRTALKHAGGAERRRSNRRGTPSDDWPRPAGAAATLDAARGFGYQGRGRNRESERRAMAVDT